MLFKLALVCSLALAAADPIRVQDSDETVVGRIVGGEDTTIESVPYQVLIEVAGEGGYCGGSIIGRHWVLTAAHCVMEDYKMLVRAGTSLLNEGGSLHTVTKKIIHEKRGVWQGVLANDIALLKVAEPFVYDETRQPIKPFLPFKRLEGGTLAVVSGWGNVKENGYQSKILRKVSLPVITNAECAKAYKKYDDTFPSRLPFGSICTLNPRGGKDSCQGDSGGPLVIDGKLLGVVSWGLGCARKDAPGVYADVAYYALWIKKTISKNAN